MSRSARTNDRFRPRGQGRPGAGPGGTGRRSSAPQGEFALPDTVTPALPAAATFGELDMPVELLAMLTKLGLNEPFPKVYATRRHLTDKARYFGPFGNSYAMNDLIDLIHKLWPLRRCAKKIPPSGGNDRPCLNHHIGNCLAPCGGLVSRENYDAMVKEILQFLNGKRSDVVKKLEAEMKTYADEMNFEKAAEVRDKLLAVRRLDEDQKVESDPSLDQDVIAFAGGEDENVPYLSQVFFIRGGKLLGREHYFISREDNFGKEEIAAAFIKQFYGEATFIPKELITEAEPCDKEVIADWLSGLKGQSVQITCPQRGHKRKLVEMAIQNAALAFNQFGEQSRREQERTVGALEEIRDALGLEETPSRIEAYDISNIQGYESVASMVVFEDGKPKRSDYRKFKIKGIYGAGDYAGMEEVVQRRFLRYKNEMETDNGKFSRLPHVLMIDGGRGQVHSVEKIMAQQNVDIPVCGMVKDDNHRTRGLIYNDEEIQMPYTSEGFKLIVRIQDEVHRFAVEYHRKLREKAQVRSVLDDVPGIGPARRKALMRHFGDIDKIRWAPADELAAAPSMNRSSAEAVYNFFRS